MKHRTHQLAVFLLSLFVGSFLLVGCGGESSDSSDQDGTTENSSTETESSESSESSGSTSNWTVNDYHDWFEKFVVTVEGIESERGCRESRASSSRRLLKRWPRLSKKHKDDPAVGKSTRR